MHAAAAVPSSPSASAVWEARWWSPTPVTITVERAFADDKGGGCLSDRQPPSVEVAATVCGVDGSFCIAEPAVDEQGQDDEGCSGEYIG